MSDHTEETNPKEETNLPAPVHGEVLLRRNFPRNTLSTQDGFYLPDLDKMAKKFVARLSRSLSKERPLGWFLFFFREDEEGEETWRARNIEDIEVEELYMTMSRGDDELAFGEDWLEQLKTAEGTLHLDPLISERPDEPDLKKPVTVRLHHYMDSTTNYAYAEHAAENSTSLEIQEMDSPGYGVGVIKGYRRNMRAVFIGYNTILQIHHAYELNSPEDIRFLFTGAEINYGEMSSPAFQKERFQDWLKSPDGLDPSVCSTLKIESVYKQPGETGRFTAGGLYSGVESEDRPLGLPGLFILSSCKRFWEVVAEVQSGLAHSNELQSSEYSAEGDKSNLSKDRKQAFKKFSEVFSERKIKHLFERKSKEG